MQDKSKNMHFKYLLLFIENKKYKNTLHKSLSLIWLID